MDKKKEHLTFYPFSQRDASTTYVVLDVSADFPVPHNALLRAWYSPTCHLL